VTGGTIKITMTEMGTGVPELLRHRLAKTRYFAVSFQRSALSYGYRDCFATGSQRRGILLSAFSGQLSACRLPIFDFRLFVSCLTAGEIHGYPACAEYKRAIMNGRGSVIVTVITTSLRSS
jgi:hypothetical protein